MKRKQQTENPDKVHENVRDSSQGVEKKASRDGERKPAAGLIGGGASGVGEMTDPRYIAPR
jgi:hypothetical protein